MHVAPMLIADELFKSVIVDMFHDHGPSSSGYIALSASWGLPVKMDRKVDELKWKDLAILNETSDWYINALTE